jgi:quinol monooxygenase YgiN
MTAWFYVYYRVNPAQAEAAREAVQRVLAEMRAGHCLHARLMSKLDEPLLWMETYEDVQDRDAFQQALVAAVRRHGLAGCLAAGERRHVEAFEPKCA